MENKRASLTLMVMTLVLLLVLAIGPVVPGLAVRVAEPGAGAVEEWDGLHGLLAPYSGGGSDGG
jgi:hypothetical protein